MIRFGLCIENPDFQKHNYNSNRIERKNKILWSHSFYRFEFLILNFYSKKFLKNITFNFFLL